MSRTTKEQRDFVCETFKRGNSIKKTAEITRWAFGCKITQDTVSKILVRARLRKPAIQYKATYVNPYETQLSGDYELLDLPDDLISKLCTSQI